MQTTKGGEFNTTIYKPYQTIPSQFSTRDGTPPAKTSTIQTAKHQFQNHSSLAYGQGLTHKFSNRFQLILIFSELCKVQRVERSPHVHQLVALPPKKLQLEHGNIFTVPVQLWFPNRYFFVYFKYSHYDKIYYIAPTNVVNNPIAKYLWL